MVGFTFISSLIYIYIYFGHIIEKLKRKRDKFLLQALTFSEEMSHNKDYSLFLACILFFNSISKCMQTAHNAICQSLFFFRSHNNNNNDCFKNDFNCILNV